MWCETRRARRLSAPRWEWVPWLRTSENEGRRKQTAREKQIRKGQHKHERENSETQWCVSVRASDRSVRVLSSWVSWRCVCGMREERKRRKRRECGVWMLGLPVLGEFCDLSAEPTAMGKVWCFCFAHHWTDDVVLFRCWRKSVCSGTFSGSDKIWSGRNLAWMGWSSTRQSVDEVARKCIMENPVERTAFYPLLRPLNLELWISKWYKSL